MDEHIANQRGDFHHKLSHRLVEENRFIGLEDLNTRGMMTCEARFAHRLAKSIGDAGWSEFADMLKYKGVWYGCQVAKVDRWYPSSKTCSGCGAVLKRLPLNLRQWQCPDCGILHDRDTNAAINILNQSTVGVTGHLYLRCQVQVSNA